ncbi:MAG: DUF4442 domain-containing protein [Flavobacteriales bacterium]|nr:DUF4442 domain-containing protein [Flavobacteriales bacterium]MCB9167985.1 DUF4442 domain-containing protein [Flavobacteriales bacterium]
MDLTALLTRARTSRFSRWLLQHVLNDRIPFNRPHGFRVEPLLGGGVRVHVPYWRINQNHIRGIHACALATAAEMGSGLSVLERLDPRQYRLIMRSLHMDYHYQAKQNAAATAIPDADALERLETGLADQDSAEYTSVVRVEDKAGNHVATGTVVWQVKPWTRVRTRA